MSAAEAWLVVAAGLAGGLLGGAGMAGLVAWSGHRPRRELERLRRLLNTTVLITRRGEHLMGPLTLEEIALTAKYGQGSAERADWLEGLGGRLSMFVAYDLINRTDDWGGWPE